MSPHLPDGVLAPSDGVLPASVASGAAERRFGVYVHVPYCRVRCGYCDFNTYTPGELGPDSQFAAYPDLAGAEMRFARGVLEQAEVVRPASTVYFGGGTPTMLGPAALARMLDEVRASIGVVADAEITTEANPDSVTPADLRELAAAGFTRVSLGMQSAVPHVLATLDRTHDPAGVRRAVDAARDAGLAVSVDLIYGTPGESMADWERTVQAALELHVDHISAYALVVEDGTKLAAQVRRGQVPTPDPDDQATKYELADDAFTAAGLPWYEISNWARPGHQSRHNLGYWDGSDWWGIGPGAHSGFWSDEPGGGVRFWNVKHPRAYAERIEAGVSPAAAREYPDSDAERLERIMLGIRTSAGLALRHLSDGGRAEVPGLIAAGLLTPVQHSAADGVGDSVPLRVALTRRGRLLADTVTTALFVPVAG